MIAEHRNHAHLTPLARRFWRWLPLDFRVVWQRPRDGEAKRGIMHFRRDRWRMFLGVTIRPDYIPFLPFDLDRWHLTVWILGMRWQRFIDGDRHARR